METADSLITCGNFTLVEPTVVRSVVISESFEVVQIAAGTHHKVRSGDPPSSFFCEEAHRPRVGRLLLFSVKEKNVPR